MTTQEEFKNMSLVDILKMSIDTLEEPENQNINLGIAQNLISQAFFKYLDLKDCPFRDVCREQIESECENDDPEPPYNWRDDVD